MTSQTISYPRTYKFAELPLKTLDTGMDGVHVSANAWGNILQINSTHDRHGVITATCFTPFRGNLCNSDLVRAYRRKLLRSVRLKNGSAGFGVILQNLEPLDRVTFEHIRADTSQTKALRTVYYCKNDITVINTIAVNQHGEIRQTRCITTSSTQPLKVDWTLGVGQEGKNRCFLARATYGQLTEGGMHEMPHVKCSSGGSITEFYVNGDTPDGKPFARLRGGVEVTSGGLAMPSLGGLLGGNQSVTLKKGSPITITARFQLAQDDNGLRKMTPLFKEWNSHQFLRTITPMRDMDVKEYIVWRNVDYVLDNCCIPIVNVKPRGGAVNPVCVITDHIALPLGWNRDNYWQLRPLMQLRAASEKAITKIWKWYEPRVYESKIDKALFGHLNWVFRQAALHKTEVGENLKIYDKPETISILRTRKETKAKTGFWARSYFLNGQPKDTSGIFQLDQQCYPFLELCDFWDTYATLPEGNVKQRDAKELVKSILMEGRAALILRLLINEIGDLGLIHTDETPGDDEVKYGHLFSCNLLVWRTFKRLSKLLNDARVGGQATVLKSLHMDQRADKIRKAMQQFETSVTLGGKQVKAFAYDCGIHERGKPQTKGADAKLQFVIYADGNDVPTLMAQKWGFLDKENEAVWHNTMDWMFDTVANKAKKPKAGAKVKKAVKDANYEDSDEESGRDEAVGKGKDKNKDDDEDQKNEAAGIVGTYWRGKNGQVSGLGSKHSPKPWPLGIYQEWRYFTMRGATVKAQNAWSMIFKCQQWDGTFSETVDMDTAACDSKAWFSWPGAMIASAIIDDKLLG